MNNDDTLQNKVNSAVSGLSDTDIEEESLETTEESQALSHQAEENVGVDNEEVTEVVNPKEPSEQERNFAQLRAKNDEVERERDYFRRKTEEYERAYAQYYEQLKSQEKAKPEPYQNQLAPTDLVEYQHIKKYDDELRNLKESLSKQQQVISQQRDTVERDAADKRLVAEFPDFNEISSKENVEKFFKEHPVEASAVVGCKDWYTFGRAYYTMAKGVGISSGKNSEKDRTRAISNMNKPRTMTSSTPRNTPLSHASSFESMSDDMLRKEMYDCID